MTNIRLNELPCQRPDSCEFEIRAEISTLLAFNQTYDRSGVPIGINPNRITAMVTCHTCGRKWDVTQYGEKFTAIEL